MSLTFPVLLSIVIRKDEHQLTKICNLFPITVFRGAHLNLLLSVCDLASIVLFGLAVYSLIDETLGHNSLWKKKCEWKHNVLEMHILYCQFRIVYVAHWTLEKHLNDNRCLYIASSFFTVNMTVGENIKQVIGGSEWQWTSVKTQKQAETLMLLRGMGNSMKGFSLLSSSIQNNGCSKITVRSCQVSFLGLRRWRANI